MQDMRLICLNTAGNKFPGIKEFLRKKKKSTEIFCFQEVVSTFESNHYPRSLHLTKPFHDDMTVNHPVIAKILSKKTKKHPQQFMHYFSPHNEFLGTTAPEGNMMAMRYLSEWEDKVDEFEFGSQDIFACEDRVLNVIMPWMMIGIGKKRVVVTTVHGVWEHSTKTDTVRRLEQSKRIVRFIEHLKIRFKCEVVIAGDFNLLPDTESIRMIEEAGLRNLIKEFGITSTRTSHYKKELRHADYVFVSPGITVNEFKVLPDEVSDHSPLYLNFTF